MERPQSEQRRGAARQPLPRRPRRRPHPARRARRSRVVSGTLIVFVVIAIAALIVVARTAVVVPQQSAYVVERLGRYHATLQAGFHILVPFFDNIRYRHTLKEV